MHPPRFGHPGSCRKKGITRSIGPLDITQGGMGHTFGIMQRGGQICIEFGVFGQGLVDDLLPFTEADQHMHPNRQIAFIKVGKRR